MQPRGELLDLVERVRGAAPVARFGGPFQPGARLGQVVEAGRLAYLAGRMPKKLYASASSPLEGLLR